jgi:hypothetical protein
MEILYSLESPGNNDPNCALKENVTKHKVDILLKLKAVDATT